MRKFLFTFVAALILVWLVHSCSNEKLPTTITIPAGSSSQDVAEILDDNDLIGSELWFRWIARQQEPIQAGTFEVPADANLDEIFAIITKPATSTRITIPEGYTIADIDQLLADKKLISKGEFSQCTHSCPLPSNFPYTQFLPADRNLEGFLFPETYFIDANNFQVSDFLDLLLTEFIKQADSQLTNPSYNPYQVLIMASIIEEEINTDQDRAIAAGIFWKRLENDWALGADATLLYKSNDRTITATDLASDNPYNTRKHKGLPPTPISNPGLKSIQAAASPQSSPYWFYLTAPSGQVIYSTTNAEHEANKAKYLR